MSSHEHDRTVNRVDCRADYREREVSKAFFPRDVGSLPASEYGKPLDSPFRVYDADTLRNQSRNQRVSAERLDARGRANLC